MKDTTDPDLAPSITRAASQHTYYTIRYLVDRPLVADAYRAYAYFRWVDDSLDAQSGSKAERQDFVNRQQRLLDGCYQDLPVQDANPEEQMLVTLVQRDQEKNSGLQAYLRHMMRVMAFDVERRGRLITQAELNEYTRNLACAVTEAMHYFIGHCCASPHDETRYLAVTAAHITHMLRDTLDDVQNGYYNIPREVLEAHHLAPDAVLSDAYRLWVRSRVQLARAYFRSGRQYLHRVQNLRCRLAGLAYTARFEGVLDAIERDGYRLRLAYPEGKGIGAMMSVFGAALPASISRPRESTGSHPLPAR